MACQCTTTTLRLFVRGIAQIDVRSIAGLATPKTFPPSKRSLSTFQSLRQQQLLSTKHAPVITPAESYGDPGETRLLSASCSLTSAKTRKWPEAHRIPGGFTKRRLQFAKSLQRNESSDFPVSVQNWERRRQCDNDSAHAENAGQGAIYEINSKSIDSLVAEARQEQVHRNLSPIQWDHTLPHNSLSVRSKLKLGKDNEGPLSTEPVNLGRLRSRREPGEENYGPSSQREPWQAQKAALKEKFKDGWNPRKRLSPDALGGIRAIHAQFPEQYTTSVLAEKFEVSPESIRRILKSKWAPKEEEAIDRQRRWFSRGQKVWMRYSELGLKPPKKWRSLGIGRKDRGKS